MDPEDVPTLREILDDNDVEFYLGEDAYQSLLTALENRELIVISDRGYCEHS